jgi:hypothetical protein
MIGTQPRIMAASVGMVALALCMTYGLLRLVATPWAGMLQFGSTSFSWQFVPLFSAIALWNISWLWFVVSGFRIHWAWGLGILIFPVAAVAFLLSQPRRGKRPALVWLSGTVLLLIVMISTPHE